MKFRLLRNTSFVFILSLLVLNISIVYAQEKVDKRDKYLISPEIFKAHIDKKKNIVILDVRTPVEYKVSHIEGSINIDYRNENFKEEVSELDKGKKYYVYCRTGKRSANSREIMNELDFKKVYDLDGGIVAWKEVEYPVENNP